MNIMTPSSSAIPFSQDIVKSQVDDRQYRHITLPSNGLQALLIHESTLDKASAALDVHVGYFSDPDGIPGLAHFLEHLLFMGTEKYPSENEYSQFLANHAGSSNAFTGSEHTNFYFDVGHEYLEPALDRFAQFFIAPLFDASCKDREIQAVDSENAGNLLKDNWRMNQLQKSLADPNHPYHKFGTGNMETLNDIPTSKGIDVRQELIQFHRKHYNSHIMKLVVYGRESLDQLQSYVVDKFSAVPTSFLDGKEAAASAEPVIPSYPPPYNDLQLKKLVFVNPLKETRSLQITWQIPDQRGHYLSKPCSYLSHLIGHEGEGSILSYLKKRGLASEIGAGTYSSGRGYAFFEIGVDLTPEGLDRFREVLQVVFYYINMLKQKKPVQWIFEECQKLDHFHFKFKEKSQSSAYSSRLAGDMHKFPPKHILSGAYLIEDIQPDLTMDILNNYLLPDKFIAYIVAQTLPKSLQSLGQDSFPLTEKWYGTNYNIQPIEEGFIKNLSVTNNHEGLNNILNGAKSELQLPKPNPFIPENFDVLPTSTKTSSIPSCILKTPYSLVWYKKDDTFLVPKMYCYFDIRWPLAQASPVQAAMSSLYIDMAKDYLTEYAYDADLSGIRYSLYATYFGATVMFSGYHDKMGVFVEKMMQALRNYAGVLSPQTRGDRFGQIKEKLKRQWKNRGHESPYMRAIYYSSSVLLDQFHLVEEKVAALDEITLDHVIQHVQAMWGQVHVECFYHGNLRATDAVFSHDTVMAHLVPMVNAATATLSTASSRSPSPSRLFSQRSQSILTHHPTTPLTPKQRYQYRRTYALEAGSTTIHRRRHAVDTVNSAVEYLLVTAPYNSVSRRAMTRLYVQMAHEPFFDVLRTKRQLGYVCNLGYRLRDGVVGVRALVQSERGVAEVTGHIEDFFRLMQADIEAMEKAPFQKHVAALLTHLRRKNKSLGEEHREFSADVSRGYQDFSGRLVEATFLENVTHDDFLAFVREVVPVGQVGIANAKVFIMQLQPALDKSEEVMKKKEAVVVDEEDGVDRTIVPERKVTFLPDDMVQVALWQQGQGMEASGILGEPNVQGTHTSHWWRKRSNRK